MSDDARAMGRLPGERVLRAWIGRAKVISGLLGFAVAAFVSHRAGLGWDDAVLRGLLGAAAFALVGWACTLLVVQALVRAAVAQQRAERRAAIEAVAARRAEEAASTSAPPRREPVAPAAGEEAGEATER